MNTPKQIFIHAGAHRTGSSSFQMCLHDNLALLKNKGFDAAYPGRDGIPSGDLALRLPSPRHGLHRQGSFAEKVARTLNKHSPDPQRKLILSEENIPGRMFHFLAGHFYPATEARLRALRQGLGDARILRLMFVVRPYDGLYVSAYRKRAEDNLVTSFGANIPNLMQMDRGWPAIVNLMDQILQPEELHVVTYACRGSSAQLLKTLIPELDATQLKEPENSVNVSATDAALRELQARYQAGEQLDRKQWKQIVREFSEHREDLGIARFSSDDATALRARYEDDLDKIANMPNISLLR
ncbi:MAG: hypothetical protein ABJL99_20815 [Aliishimia sp.]